MMKISRLFLFLIRTVLIASLTHTEDSDASCERWKINGKDRIDSSSSRSPNLQRDYGSHGAKLAIAFNATSGGGDKGGAEHDSENLKNLNNAAIDLPQCGIGILRESGIRLQCIPSASKKLKTRKLKVMVRRRMKWLKGTMKEQDDKGGEKELWRNRILMGRRCRPLEISGVIQNDEGIRLPRM